MSVCRANALKTERLVSLLTLLVPTGFSNAYTLQLYGCPGMHVFVLHSPLAFHCRAFIITCLSNDSLEWRRLTEELLDIFKPNVSTDQNTS